MHEAPYQAVLFEVGEPIAHWAYATTNGLALKFGYSEDVEKRMKNPQFKGHVLISKWACNCTPRRVGRRLTCEREIAWARAHEADRLPTSEQYRLSNHVLATLGWMVDRRDRRAVAVLNWAERFRLAPSA